MSLGYLVSSAFWLARLGRVGEAVLLAIPVLLALQLIGWLAERRLAAWMTGHAAPDRGDAWQRERAERLGTAARAARLSGQVVLSVAAVLAVWGVDPLAWAVLVATVAWLSAVPLRERLACLELLLADSLAPGDTVRGDGLCGVVERIGAAQVVIAGESGEKWQIACSAMGRLSVAPDRREEGR